MTGASFSTVKGADLSILPGLALAGTVAVAANVVASIAKEWFPMPSMVVALVVGIALSKVASRPIFEAGFTFCIKKMLRWAVALLGFRIALGDIVDLGAGRAVLVVGAMTVTVAAGFWVARLFRQPMGFGALAGAATAVCGASATLATATVVPEYPQKRADIAFTVVAVNLLSTVAMLAYPPLCRIMELDEFQTGVLLGATIHDVAQVVGAGYAVSEDVGNTAVIVKLFRVFLLLPTVLIIGWWFTWSGKAPGSARVPVPVFAIVFLAFCILNSVVTGIPGLLSLYTPIRTSMVDVSQWGMLIAIAALGLTTSPRAIAALGWRHLATISATTMLILAVVAGGMLGLG